LGLYVLYIPLMSKNEWLDEWVEMCYYFLGVSIVWKQPADSRLSVSAPMVSCYNEPLFIQTSINCSLVTATVAPPCGERTRNKTGICFFMAAHYEWRQLRFCMIKWGVGETAGDPLAKLIYCFHFRRNSKLRSARVYMSRASKRLVCSGICI
jgi:hypothetical protein